MASPAEFPLYADLGHGLPKVCRLGLASRGNTGLSSDGVLRAVETGVNYLNWCGEPDGMSHAIRELGCERKNVVVSAQLSALDFDGMRRELEFVLDELAVDCLDVPTFYWMESREQWAQLMSERGGYRALLEAREQGRVKLLGLTSHQRKLAAEIAAEGSVDLLMIRYNAAHSGAERDIFPTTQARCMPVVAYTCLRWGALMRSTPDDPPGYDPPRAPSWYRWTLQHPGVAVALMAPDNLAELDENLKIMEAWQPLGVSEYEELTKHGQRVYRHAGNFP